ncbi:MAG: hypothetical protein ACE5IK_00820 [Acidobacteriota bacterium]
MSEIAPESHKRDTTRASLSRRERPRRLTTLDGVIMLSPDGRPAGGSFPDNVWVVMGDEDDSIEDFFGDCDDVITGGLVGDEQTEDTRFCVGFNAGREAMVMNGKGAFPVYVSGLLRLHLQGNGR